MIRAEMKTHQFSSTGEAYDACQCDEDIQDGDILVIESEGVIGVADTWPVAVTAEHGSLHSFDPMASGFTCWLGSFPADKQEVMRAGIQAGIELAKLKEYPLHALFN